MDINIACSKDSINPVIVNVLELENIRMKSTFYNLIITTSTNKISQLKLHYIQAVILKKKSNSVKIDPLTKER